MGEIPKFDQFPERAARVARSANSSVPKAAALDSPLLTRHEAAGYCRISLRTFDRLVAAEVPRVRIGCRCLYDRRDIERWLERHKVGSSTRTRGPGSIRSGSASAGSVTIDPLARRIAQRLRARLPGLVRRVTEGNRLDHAAPDVPLPELIGSWLAGVGPAVSPETSRTWELYAGTHFIPHFGSTEGLCSERRLQDYMRLRLGVVKARTVQKELSSLRSLFAWMVERGLLQEAPAVPKVPRRATGTAHPSGRRKRIVLSPEEMDAIVAALPERTRDGSHAKPTSQSCAKPGFDQAHSSGFELRTTIGLRRSSSGYAPRPTRPATSARYR